MIWNTAACTCGYLIEDDKNSEIQNNLLWITDILAQLPFSVSLQAPSHVHCYLVAHYNDVIMDSMASQITSLTIVYSAVYSGADQRKHQSSASLAFVRGIHRRPVNSPHKWPVTPKMFHLMTSSWTGTRLRNSCNHCNHGNHHAIRVHQMGIFLAGDHLAISRRPLGDWLAIITHKHWRLFQLVGDWVATVWR